MKKSADCGYRADWRLLLLLDVEHGFQLIGLYVGPLSVSGPVGSSFPLLKAHWPRNGHPEKLLNHFAERRPPILTWARSSFEQGSLPSMLHLPGEAVLMILPGDRMFQAQYLVQQRCRPAILHGYGGGKHAMPRH